MQIERRHVALAATALGLSLLAATPAVASTADEQAVAKNLSAFRAAHAARNVDALAPLCAEQLSYSHSDARVETKAEFLKGVMNPNTRTLLLEYNNPSIQVVGDVATVRFTWKSESEVIADGKRTTTNLHILMTWQKQAGEWKLLSRSSTRI
jgi:ketosteroid isomerase-like protein